MTAPFQVLHPNSLVDCAHYACKLFARACVLRQTTSIKNSYGAAIKTENLSSFCRTGKCELGREVAAQLGGQVVEPARKPSGFLPRLKLVTPTPRTLERRRIAPLSTLPPAALEDVGEDLDEACAPRRPAPPPPEQLEKRRAEIAAAVLARREEEAAVRPPPPRRRRRPRDPLRGLCDSIGSYVAAHVARAFREVVMP